MHEKPEGCLWCEYRGPVLAGDIITVVNPQVTLPHELRRCPTCREAMVDIRWPDRIVRRKVRESPRRFRRSLWVVVYPVECAWCGSHNTDAYEVNATVSNPVSTRFKYDIYRCLDCQRPNAISYLGEVYVHRADQDKEFFSLWHLDPELEQSEPSA